MGKPKGLSDNKEDPKGPKLGAILGLLLIPVALWMASVISADLFLQGWPRGALWMFFVSALIVIARGQTYLRWVFTTKPISYGSWVVAVILVLGALYLKITAPPPNMLIPDNRSYARRLSDRCNSGFRAFLGTNAVVTNSLPMVALSFVDDGGSYPVIVLSAAEKGALYVSAYIRDQDRSLVAHIVNNQLVAPSSGFIELAPDGHRLITKNKAGDIVLQVYFENETTVIVERGLFRYPGFPDVVVEPEKVVVPDRHITLEKNCISTSLQVTREGHMAFGRGG